MPIPLGMPVLADLSDIASQVDLCEQLGLSFIELNMNFPAFQMWHMDTSKYRSIKNEFAIDFTLHLDEQLDVCSFNPLVARAWSDTVLQAIVWAKQVSIPIINMHLPLGTCVTLPHEKLFLYARYRDDYLFRLQHFRNMCKQTIGDDTIYICVENTAPFQPFQREAVDFLLESPCFALTFDIGHDYMVRGANESFFMARESRIKYMHIHDVIGNQGHLSLGKGEIDFTDKLLMAQTYQCRCAVETKSVDALTESAVYLKKAGYL